MSTLQNTHTHHERTRTRLGAGALALSTAIVIGVGLLIVPTAHRTTTPPTASVAHPAPAAALTTQGSGLGDCLVNPETPAIACYNAAGTPIASPAASVNFRDPITHQLLLRTSNRESAPRQLPPQRRADGFVP